MTDTASEKEGKEGIGSPAPRVSVVIPAFNAQATLVQALQSVLDQSFRDYEVIVCDDGSSDGSRELAQELLSAQAPGHWSVLQSNGAGAGGARNRGIQAARGEFIAFLDDDDLWDEKKLARCVDELDAGPLDMVCHSEVWLDDAGNRSVRVYSDLFDPQVLPLVSLLRNNPFSTSAVVVRRASVQEAGLFDEELPSAEDYDLWIRLALLPGFRIGFIDDALGVYALREGSESSKVDRRLQALLAIGERFKKPLRASAPRGRLEHWKYVGKTYFTTGIRYAQQGRPFHGAAMALKGFAMWPFRVKWVLMAVRNQRRRRGGPEG